MKTKLIKILTVATLSVGSIAAVSAIVATTGQSEMATNLSADDTRTFEITAQDIANAIGDGSSGDFTVNGISFHTVWASIEDGKATYRDGYLETTVTAGSTTGESGLAGAGYTSVEFVDFKTTAGVFVRALDDDKNQLGEKLVTDVEEPSYSVNVADYATAARSVTNLRFSFCGGADPELLTSFSAIKFSYKCAVPADKHLVRFVVNGNVYAQQHVVDGQKATAPANDPTREPTAEVAKYVFTGWDKDPATTVITEDIDFWAEFDEYARQDLVDDFESYVVDAELEDGNWFPYYYKQGAGWTKETTATVVLSKNSIAGSQSIRLNAFRNQGDYCILKEFPTNPFTRLANTVKFTMMAPSNATACRVLLNTIVTNPLTGDPLNVTIKHDIPITSSEYVEYQIPYDATGWKIWDDVHDNLREDALTYGINIDKLHSMLTDMQFYFKYPNVTPGSNFCAFVDEVSFVTTDLDEIVKTEVMKQYNRYTGYNVNDNVVRIDINNDLSATASVIDIETPVNIPGNVTIDGNVMTFTSADSGATLTYVGNATDRGQKVNFVSATGALSGAVNGMNLSAVQVMDNFEQYTQDGQSYCEAHPNPDERYGCRGAYYSEYYDGDSSTKSSPWGGAHWSLMGGDGSQLKLKSDGGHTGSKYVCMKNSSGKGMRYMQWDLFAGTGDVNSFRGTTFSFWAKTNGIVKKTTAYCYFQSAPTNATRDSFVKKSLFQENAAIGSWKHYTIDLDPNQVYYGFMFYLDANWTADSFLYVDDVEIYTADPYAEYVPPVPQTDAVLPVGMTYNTHVDGLVNALVEITGDGTAHLSVPAYGYNVDGTFSSVLDEVTFVFGNTTYVATASDDVKTLTFVSVSEGTWKSIFNNSDFQMIEYADNAETYESAGKMYYQGNTDESQASGARGAYHCDYYTGGSTNLSPIGGNGWSLMGGNGDQLDLDTTNSVDGTKSIKMKYSSAGNMRYLQWDLKTGTGPSHSGFNKIGFYAKNPNNVNVPIKFYAYFNTALTPATQGDSSRTAAEFTIPANSDWTFYSMDLNSAKTYYGYGVYMNTKAATGFINFDKVFYYNDYESPEMDTFATSGLTLSGNITAGAASMEFKANGGVDLTCAALGGTVSGKYKFEIVGMDQIMTVTISGDVNGTFSGKYSVAANGTITLEITASTGDFVGGVTAGNTLTGQIL